MTKNNYSYSFETSRPQQEVFDWLLDVKKWWFGLFDETFSGKYEKINDEFTFSAGNGAHFTRQKLVELVPSEKITWLVTESRLNFIPDPAEWQGTKISFYLSAKEHKTSVVFVHEGLFPAIECYEACSGAWTGYLDNLKKAMG